MIIKIGILIGLLLVLKIAYNLYYFLLAKYYCGKYIEFAKRSSSWFVKEHKQQIIKLLKKAGIEDAFQPSTEPTGYGMIATSTFSVFRNMTVTREDIVTIIIGDFREAIGVYRQRIFESFNPFYWIETFLQLPRVLLEYLDVNPKSIFFKMFQLFWWIIVAVSTIVGIVFNKDFISWTKQTL